MKQTTYRKKGIRITQVWFPDESPQLESKSDILFIHGVENCGLYKNCMQNTFHTLISDLEQTQDEIWSLINKNVRYEIRRSMKEEVYCLSFSSGELLNKPEIIKQFADMYQLMYHDKGITQTLYMPQIDAYLKENMFLLTGIFTKESKPLVFHSYIVGEKCARLLHSVSDFRSGSNDANLVARANKRLHWEDICMLIKLGLKRYDWGGVSSIESPNGIDEFKFKFGGQPLTYYNVYKGKSLLGKILVILLKIKNRNNG